MALSGSSGRAGHCSHVGLRPATGPSLMALSGSSGRAGHSHVGLRPATGPSPNARHGLSHARPLPRPRPNRPNGLCCMLLPRHSPRDRFDMTPIFRCIPRPPEPGLNSRSRTALSEPLHISNLHIIRQQRPSRNPHQIRRTSIPFTSFVRIPDVPIPQLSPGAPVLTTALYPHRPT